MTLQEEVSAYLAGVIRRNQLTQLEIMNMRPSLATRRAVRPRPGFLVNLARLVLVIFLKRPHI